MAKKRTSTITRETNETFVNVSSSSKFEINCAIVCSSAPSATKAEYHDLSIVSNPQELMQHERIDPGKTAHHQLSRGKL